jgi:hypothetical protein
LHEKLIKQIKNQQEIIANLSKPKDSHLLEDTNSEAVAEQEARQPDAVTMKISWMQIFVRGHPSISSPLLSYYPPQLPLLICIFPTPL